MRLSKKLLCLVAILLFINTQTGCTVAFNEKDTDETKDTIDYSDTDENNDTENEVETETETENEADSETGSGNDEVCDAVNFFIESSPPNLLILLDRSGSMSRSVEGTPFNRWEVCSNAVLHLVSDLNNLIRFGLGTFSSWLQGGCSPGSIGAGGNTNLSYVI